MNSSPKALRSHLLPSCRAFTSAPRPKSTSKPKPSQVETKFVFKRTPNVSYPNNQLRTLDAKGHQRRTAQGAFANAKFLTSAALPKDLPPKGALQEVVFAGRSNSGKSSLLNALFSSRSLVKTSSKAGHTKMLNFFTVPDQFIMVDAPGYGEKGRPEWGELFQYYVTKRQPSPPSLVVQLFPLNHGLLPSDELFLQALPSTVALLPIFTKLDLCPIGDIEKKVKAMSEKVWAARAKGSEGEEQPLKNGVGKTWDPLCVSVKKGWALRDETVDTVRSVIITQLELTANEHTKQVEDYMKAEKLRRKKDTEDRSWRTKESGGKDEGGNK